MSYNIGPKIGIDGETEFRKQIRDINSEYKALEAETRALTAAYEAQGDEQGKLEKQTGQLEKQIDTQKRKMKLLEDAVSKAADKFGENSIEATRLRGALYDTQATVADLESELGDTNRKLTNLAEGFDEVSEEASDAGDSILDFGDILNANLAADLIEDGLHELADVVADFAKGSLDAASDVNAAGSQFEQTFGDMEDTARKTLEAISDDTKIAVTRMQGDFTKMYAFTKTAGAGSEEAMDIAGRAMEAAADSAAYYDKSIEDVTETLQSFLKGNYENDAALGISATETTRNTKANEMYATSFNKLSEAQKVDVLLAMVEAGNAASGALGQAAREADSWVNVQGELNEAIHQLQATLGQPALKAAIPIVQSLTEGVYDLIEKADWQKLDDGISDFVSSMEGAEKQFQDTGKEIESTAYTAEWFVNRLKDLEKAGLDTTDAQNEYAAIVKELNNLIPDLNLTIDEQTGLIEQNTDAILDDIKAWKDRATAQALQNKVTAQLKAQGEAEADLYTAKAKLIELQAEQADLERQLAEATGDASTEARQQRKELEANSQTFVKSDVALSGLVDTFSCAVDPVAQLEKQLEENEAAQGALNREITEGEEILSSYDDDLDAAKASLALYNKENKAGAKDQDVMTAKIREVEQNIETLTAAYVEAETEARKSIDSQIGLFEKFSMESSMTTSEIIANWQKQQVAFQNYAANLQKAVDMGLDQALIEQLSDGSAQSMIILDQFVNGTEVRVDEINAAFKKLDSAKNTVSSAMAEIRTGANAEIDKLIADASTWGADIVAGAVAGVKKNAYRFNDAMSSLGKNGSKFFKVAMDINSPSGVMIDASEDVVDGAVVGVELNAERFENAMADLAEVGQMAFLDEKLIAAENYPSILEVPGYSGAPYSSTAVDYGGFNFHIYQNDGESVDELADRIMDRIQTEIIRKEGAL